MSLHLTIDLRAVLIGVVLLLVAGGIATPFAISLADDGPAGDRVSEQRAVALGTAFTYQGRLSDASGPATGLYDFQFRLFDAASGGALVVTTPTFVETTTTVADGLFSVDLDFGNGPGVFNGSARYLEVKARPSNSGSFDTLGPRQELTPVPYALFALSGGTPYTAGTGLTLTGTQFSVQFLAAGAVAGLATTAARSDHNHLGQSWTGSGGLQINTSGTAISASSSIEAGLPTIVGQNTTSGSGVSGYSQTGPGGSFGSSTAQGIRAGSGSCPFGLAPAAVWACSNPNPAIIARSFGNRAVYGETLTGDSIVGKGGSGFAGILGVSRNGANTIWGVYSVGNLGVEGSYPSSSDLRLKRNVVPVEHGLDAVQRLRPVSFAWQNSADDNQHMGFLAQDVQEVFPDLVVAGRDGMLMLEYSGIIPVLTKAIQEQQAQIEALKAGAAAGTRDEGPTSEPHITTARESVSASPLNGWALPGAVGLFALGLFAVAGALVRRRS